MIPRDNPESVRVLQSERTYTGNIWAVDKQSFELAGEVLVRDHIVHMGAVAVAAVNGKGELLVITQYRHAVGHRMVELPAGLLDELQETPQQAAERELFEEAGVKAADWSVLVDICTTPGSSTEALRVFRAQDIIVSAAPAEPRYAEESQIECFWVPLDEAVAAVLRGDWQNPTVVAGVLALAAGGPTRPADAPWPLRDWEETTGRVFRR